MKTPGRIVRSNPSVLLREEPRDIDAAAVERLLIATGYFRDAEVRIGVELVEERRARGPSCDYRFVFADEAVGSHEIVGYTCYGEIPCTVGSYDLYWIAVDPSWQGRGLGRHLLEVTESRVLEHGGRRLFAETSGRADYRSTQAFYEANGYRIEAVLEDFYAPGDPKFVYGKVLRG